MAVDTRTSDLNKALVRRAIGHIHGTSEDPADIFAPEFTAYMPGRPPMDRPTFEEYVAGTTVVFPGYSYEIHDQIAQGDLVVNRVTWRGIHGGEFAGVPPTHRPLELSGINMFEVKEGRVVAEWAQLDIFGLLQQIGAVPAV